MNPRLIDARTGASLTEIAAMTLGLIGVLMLAPALVGESGRAQGYVFMLGAVVIVSHRSVASGLLWLVGRAYMTWRPEQALGWSSSVPPQQLIKFLVYRISPEEAERVNADTLADYRWVRRFERRAQIRFGTDAYPAVSINVLSLILASGTEVDALGDRRRRLDTLPAVWLRAIAVSARYMTAGQPLSWHLRGARAYEQFINESLAALVNGMAPEALVGWTLAHQQAVRDDALPWNAGLKDTQALLPHRQRLPGWLLYLAGVNATEALPADTDEEGLLLLAALRGHPKHLLDLPAQPTDLSGRTRILIR